MPRMTQRAKPKPKARKALPRKRTLARKRSAVPRKATNWLHARARDVKRGHNVRGTILGLVGGFCATLILALWLSGGMGDAMRSAARATENGLLAAGFSVDYIEVVGPSGKTVGPLDTAAVRRALAVEEGEMVFSVNLVQARQRIENLGWIKEARVMRQLPNRLTVIVIERAPYALWQYEGKWRVISKNGKVIVSAKAADFPDLPLVVGKGGAEELQSMLTVMQHYPRLASRVQSYVRVSGRRWNLRLNNGADLMLPAHNPALALTVFENNDRAFGLLNLALKRIDARLPGQIFVRPDVSKVPIPNLRPERLS